MAIQIPNVGTGVPADQTGDSPWAAMQKVADNFSNATHAASRLVGIGAEQVPLSKNIPSILGAAATRNVGTAAGQVPLSDSIMYLSMSKEANHSAASDTRNFTAGTKWVQGGTDPSVGGIGYQVVSTYATNKGGLLQVSAPYNHGFGGKNLNFRLFSRASEALENVWSDWIKIYTDSNVTKDANGFLKGASPIVKVHADKVVLNDEAEQQNVTFKKNGIGDYTITTELGLSTDGWYLELPKDLNGNPKVAITLTETDGIIELKCYKRIFSMETFTFEPDLDSPVDVPDGRWIDIRLNEIEHEAPTMPDVDLDKED